MIGADQMLSSVFSEALKCSNSVYLFPAESVTLAAVAPPELQMPTSTISRLPAVTLDEVVTERLLTLALCAEAVCTNTGLVAAEADAVRAARAREPPR